MGNILPIARRRGTAEYTLFRLLEVQDWRARSHLSVITPGGPRIACRYYFRPTLLRLAPIGSTLLNWMALHSVKSSPNLSQKRNCGCLQQPGIRMERESPFGLEILRPVLDSRQAPAFGRYRFRVGPESRWKFHQRFRRSSPGHPVRSQLASSWESILFPGHLRAMLFISSEAS